MSPRRAIPARARARRGFTLLEVMVALALLAAALAAVADLTGNALRNHAYARDLSAATLLARGKLAELEQKYDDEGFKDFDQQDDGDFSDAARPDVRWHVELVKPDADFSADQLVSMLAGTGTDPKELLGKLMGGAGAGAAAAGAAGAAASGGASAGGPTTTSNAMGTVTTLIQGQLTAFGELLKKSFRELRLTVSWPDGKLTRSFTVTTHLLVLNPKAPGGARGDDPEIPASLPRAGLPAAGLPGVGVPGLPGLPGLPGVPGAATLGGATGIPGAGPGVNAFGGNRRRRGGSSDE